MGNLEQVGKRRFLPSKNVPTLDLVSLVFALPTVAKLSEVAASCREETFDSVALVTLPSDVTSLGATEVVGTKKGNKVGNMLNALT